MKLERNMPQLIPMHGKRIRLYYRGIIKRCTNCFGSHQRKNCKEEKVPWIKYVEQFITNYPEIPRESNGRWVNMIDGMSPTVDGNKTVVPEQSTSMGANSQKPTLKPSSKVRPKESQLATKTAEKDGNETKNEEEHQTERATEDVQKLMGALAGGKEDERETARKKNSKTEEETEQEELYQVVQSLVASGMSIKAIEEFFLSGKTETKKRQRGLKLGRGRGRGIGSGKGKGT
jgi:hypothetical protein